MPAKTIAPESNAAIVGRLKTLLESRSQAEIARKTSTLRNNVSRYMRGGKIPIDFGAALVHGLGLNPAWLLVGEGAPFLSDVTAGTVKAAENLLELVEAMSAVARMQLGSLTGKHHLKVLRDLSDALTQNEKLRQELNTKTAPIFRQILADYWKALDKWDFERAEELRKAAMQIARLSDDEKLAAEFDRTRAFHAYLQHDEQQAIAMQRRVFQRSLPSGMLLDDRAMREAYNFATTLQGSSRMHEARRVAQAVLVMAPPEAGQWPITRFITALCGFVESELGDIRSGLARIQASFPQADDRMRPSQTSMLLHTLMFTGAITFQACCAMGSITPAHSQGMLIRAVFEDTTPALELACGQFIDQGPSTLPENQLMSQFARALLRAMKGSNDDARQLLAGALKDALEKAKSVTERFDMLVFSARIQRVVGENAAARNLLLEAEKVLAAVPPEITVGLLGRALFWRNVLAVCAPESKSSEVVALRKRGHEFFLAHLKNGYGCFESLAG